MFYNLTELELIFITFCTLYLNSPIASKSMHQFLPYLIFTYSYCTLKFVLTVDYDAFSRHAV